MESVSDIRRRAWQTRRDRYGQKGHVGAYSRGQSSGLLNLVIRLHREGVLSEGQVAKASGLDRVEIRRLADLHPHPQGDPRCLRA